MYRIVLIDDEPWVLSGLEELLDWERFGFKIVGKFTNSLEAFKNICSIRPDAIITDIRMPKMSGIELMCALKKENINAEVVLISAYRDFEAAREGIRYGAFRYILKPFQQDEVEKVILLLAKKLRESNKPTIIDPNHITPSTEQILRQAAVYPNCLLILCDHPEKMSLDKRNIHETRVWLDGGDTVFLVSAKTKELVYSMISKFRYDPIAGVGFSRLQSDFLCFFEMLEEAKYALNNGFTYSPNSLAADIQLFICRSIPEQPSLTDIASKFYLSKTYLSDMFKEKTGSTITEFIQYTRLYHAARKMLLTPNQDLKEIAIQLGYTDYSYFGRIFKRQFGVSPSEYRNSILGD